MAAALVAVTTFWEFLRGDTGLPRPSAWRQMLQATPERGPQPPKPAAYLTPALLRRPLVRVPFLEGRLPGEGSAQGVGGRTTSRSVGWVGEALPLSASASPSEALGRGRLLSQPPPADPHPPPQVTMLIKPHRHGSENRG